MVTQFNKLVTTQSVPQISSICNTRIYLPLRKKCFIIYTILHFLKELLDVHMVFTFILCKYQGKNKGRELAAVSLKLPICRANSPESLLTQLSTSVTNDHPYPLPTWQHTSMQLTLWQCLGRSGLCLYAQARAVIKGIHLPKQELSGEVWEATLWSTYYYMKSHKKTGNIREKKSNNSLGNFSLGNLFLSVHSDDIPRKTNFKFRLTVCPVTWDMRVTESSRLTK